MGGYLIGHFVQVINIGGSHCLVVRENLCRGERSIGADLELKHDAQTMKANICTTSHIICIHITNHSADTQRDVA